MNFCDIHTGEKKRRQILAALNALELGSAHTTALTNPFGTARIPRAGGKAQHSRSTLEVLERVVPIGKGQAPEQSLCSPCVEESPAEAWQRSLPQPRQLNGEHRRTEMLGAKALIMLKFYHGN